MKTILILLISLFSFTYLGKLQAQVGAQTTPVPCETGNGIAKNIKYKVNGSTRASLKGNVRQGDTLEVIFTVPIGATPTRFSLVAYNATANSTSAKVREQHLAYDYDMGVFGQGTHSLSVFVPSNYFEVDFVIGCIIWKFDANNNGYNNRLISQENGGLNPACASCNEKVTICHVPKGNPANAHSITISVKAAQAHIGEHGGDYYGECIDSLDVTVSCDEVIAWSNRKIETITLLLVYYRIDAITGEPVPSSIDSTIEVVNVNSTSANISVYDFNFDSVTVCDSIATDICATYYKDFKIYGAYVLLDGHNESTILDASWTGSEVTVYGLYFPNPDYEICDRLIDVPLPVKLTRFEAKKVEPNVVKLEWTTASETNNDYIAIEKSSDIENWKEVCRVPSDAPGGNSQHVHDYSCYDHNANEEGQNIVYYRPKQVDLNGTYEYHNTIRVRLMDAAYATEIQSVYPNPATDRLKIKYNASENNTFNLRLISIDGKSLLQNKFIAKPGVQTYDLDLMEDKLKPGLYVLEIQTETEIFRQKVYKQ
ncbi:MAG: T9SS type A sorting domain-containing protein [Bacteroidia bacterium]